MMWLIWIGFLILTAPIWIPLAIVGCIGYVLFFAVCALLGAAADNPEGAMEVVASIGFVLVVLFVGSFILSVAIIIMDKIKRWWTELKQNNKGDE